MESINQVQIHDETYWQMLKMKQYKRNVLFEDYLKSKPHSGMLLYNTIQQRVPNFLFYVFKSVKWSKNILADRLLQTLYT